MAWNAPIIGSRPVVVLGAGVLGRRIACVFVAGGHRVHVFDLATQSRVAAMQFIDESKENFATYAKTPKGHPLGSYAAFDDLGAAVQEAWLVIEAIPERLELKVNVFEELDRKSPADCIFGSNSSSFRSSLMVAKTRNSRRPLICNIHFTMPPDVRSVELMTDGETHPAIFPFLSEILRRCGMLPVTARKESTGFIFNRLWAAIKREIMMMLAEGVTEPPEIDLLFEHMFRAKILPCQLMDKIGLDTVAFIEDNYIQERNLDGTMTVDWLREQYLRQGRLGQKGDKGGLYPPNAPASNAPTSEAPDQNITETSNGEPSDSREPHTAPSSDSLYLLDVGIGANLRSVDQVAANGKVLRLDLATGQATQIVTGLKMPDGIDVSKTEGRIFWTNMGRSTSTHDGCLMSSKLDGSDVQTIIAEGQVHTPKQLAIVEDQRKIYFCDREGMGVHRCNFDGSGHEILIRRRSEALDMTQWCVGVAVDVEAGKIYWTQKGPSKAGKGRIFRANIDVPAGEHPEDRSDIELLMDNLPEPIDLELDASSKCLYWTDRGEHPTGCSLNRVPIRADSMKPTIVARHFNEPIGLKIDPVKRQVYVVDLGGSVYRIEMDSMDRSLVFEGDGSYTGVTLVMNI